MKAAATMSYYGEKTWMMRRFIQGQSRVVQLCCLCDDGKPRLSNWVSTNQDDPTINGVFLCSVSWGGSTVKGVARFVTDGNYNAVLSFKRGEDHGRKKS